MSMLGLMPRIFTLGLLLFGSFSSSPHFALNSYSVGPGGTNSASSTTYKAQANVGEQTNQTTSGTTYTTHGGAIKTEQLNVPLAPTLSNGSGTYYDKLQVTINTGILPSDTTYAIGVSTSSCTPTPASYVQIDGTLNSSVFYQNYSSWGSSSGTTIVGLAPSTTYYVSVAAKQGLFTNTKFGPCASISTVSPSISFSLSPSSESLGNLNAGSVVSTASTPITFNFTTNANSGGDIYVAGQNSGLYSPLAGTGYTINAVTTNLATASEGFGLQAASATETSGGPLLIQSPYNGTADNVGLESSSFAPVFTSANPISGGTGTLNLFAKSAASDPASQAYQEILTFIASAGF